MILSRIRKPALSALFLSVLGLALSGCGAGSGGAPVEGSVTLDGKPVDGGTITFVSENPKVHPVLADIKGGKYALDAAHGLKPGKYRVEINWKQKTGRQIPSNDPPNTIDEEIVRIGPDNPGSRQEAEIKESGNKFDYTIVSQVNDNTRKAVGD